MEIFWRQARSRAGHLLMVAQEENSCQIKMSSSNSPLLILDGLMDAFVWHLSQQRVAIFCSLLSRTPIERILKRIFRRSGNIVQIICLDNIQPVHLLLCQLVYINYHVKLSRLDDDHQPSTCSKCKKNNSVVVSAFELNPTAQAHIFEVSVV